MNKWEKMQQDKFHTGGRDVYKNDVYGERVVESEWDIDRLYQNCGCEEVRNGYGLLLDHTACINHQD